jgi:hypothetical protein
VASGSTVMTDSVIRSRTLAFIVPPVATCRLIRIRRQLAIYFRLHRGSLNENTAKWQV